MDMILNMKWTDSRIEFNNKTFLRDDRQNVVVSSNFLDTYLWQPVPYIANIHKAAVVALTQKYVSVRITRTKLITFSSRLTVVLGCQMDFQDYPVDLQNCSLTIESCK